MNHELLFSDRLYQQTAALILLCIVTVGLGIFFVRKKNTSLAAAWGSLKSWFFVAPLILFMMGLPSPWPLVFLTLVGIFSAKTFFQMTGMYHRTWFVMATYLFIALTGLEIHLNIWGFYNLMPMIFMGVLALIPLIRNSPDDMIQYMALSLMAFLLFGWSYMHMAALLSMDKGAFVVIYLYFLTEFSQSAHRAASRFIGRIRPFSKISMRFTLEGLLISTAATLGLAFAMRELLPDRSEQYWIAAGLIAAIFGGFGDLFLSVIRRDLGIKNPGIFILGRGDLLSRVDKLTFVGPFYYYIFIWLIGHPS
jgi:phosphatidate cytidylyltransferase